MYLLRSINIQKVRNSNAIKNLLKMAGYAGPWSEKGPAQLFLTEESGCTTISLSPVIPQLSHFLEPTLINESVSTVSVINIARDLPPLFFPLQGIEHYHIKGKLLKSRTEVMRTKKSNHLLAIVGHYEGSSTLALGFSLSDFMEMSYRRYYFFGYGHMILILKWFIEKFANLPAITISPWKNGKPPLLLSFDVEGHVSRRSMGKTVFRVPFFKRDLVHINLLKIIKPMVTKRIIPTVNYLRDPDGNFKSYRFIIDTRRCSSGLFCDNLEVNQWQFHFLIKKPSRDKQDGHRAFTQWALDKVKNFTNFYCGLKKEETLGIKEAGFHSTNHRHFNQLELHELRQELLFARNTLFPPNCPRAVRAPGLFWSREYFKALGELNFHMDSSFKETNSFQPIFPISTNQGWWEVPVTGNLFNVSTLEKTAAVASISGGILSFYAHDYDLESPEQKERYLSITTSLFQKGFVATGLLEFLDWLNVSQENEINEISELQDGSILVTARLVPNSALVAKNLSGYQPRSISKGSLFKTGLDQQKMVFHEDGDTHQIVLLLVGDKNN